MKLRLTYLIQAVFAVLVAVGLSFGASRAMASESTAAGTCEALGYDYYDPSCAYSCPRNQGYCSYDGYCRCGNIP